MKKIFNSLFVIIASMVAFSACVKEENSPASETKTVQFFAESIETKTHFDAPVNGKYPTLWDDGDKVKVFLNLESPTGVSGLEKIVDVTEISADSKSASFAAELNNDHKFDSYTFYAVVPSSAYNARSFNEGRFTVIIPANQTPQEGSVDKAAQVLYAVSETTSTMPSSVPMTFKHYTAYGKLSLSNLTSKVSTVSSITLESAGAGLAGKWNYFVADGSVAAREGTDKLTLTTSATENIWFACAPVDMSGKELVLTVNTDKGPLSKTITFPANRKFESGKISVFTVDMAGIEPEEPSESSQYYVKVTEAPSDWSGKYLIVFGNNAHAKLASGSKDLNSTCSVTVVDDKIAATDAIASAVMTVTKAEDKYNMTFADGTYFGMQHNGCLLMTSAFDLDFEYTSSGVKISGYVSDKSATYILYNNSNQYYRCYVDKNGQSGYTLPTLYKLEAESEGGETPAPEERNLVSISVSDDAKIEYGVGAEFVKPTVTASYDDNSTADVTASATFSGYDMNTTGTHTVTVSYAENDVTATTTYTITVSENEEPDGPTDITVADFLELKNTATEYILTGKITRVANESYGNFDLTDATGTVYVYGLLTPDGVAQKQWAAAGLKQGDIITVKGVYNEYNGSSQIKNAVYVSHKGISVDKASYTFAAEGGSFEVTATLVNASDAVSVSVDNPHFNVALKSGTTYTVTAPANQTEEDIYANLTFTAGELSALVSITQTAPVPEDEIIGGRDDFNTVNANTSYNSYKTTAGWQATNSAVLQGGTKDSNPTYKFIGSTSATRAFCMNGKTSAKGTITSPTLTTGCGTLKFNYGLPFSDTKIKFKVEIKQNGAVVKTITIDKSSASKTTKYSHEESVNVSGDFQIVFTNLSPSNSTSNKDRTAVWDVEWTGCN